MTLILSAYAKGHTYQVSDRMLSVYRTPGGHQPVYAYANKSLIVQTVDAVVTIGVTGVAYIGDETTDTWVAKTLLSELETDGKRYWGMGRRTLPQLVDVLRRTLPPVLLQIAPAVESDLILRLEIAGQQIDRRSRTFWPVQLSLDFVLDRGMVLAKVVSHRARGRLGKGTDIQFLFSSPVGRGMEQRLRERFKAAGLATQTAFEQVLVDTLRSVAENSPTTVGQDCMLVDVVPSLDGPTSVRVQFFPSTHGLQVAGHGHSFPMAFTPGLLCPGGFLDPSVSNADVAIYPYIEMRVTGLSDISGPPMLMYRGPLVPPKPHELLRQRNRRPRLPGIDPRGRPPA